MVAERRFVTCDFSGRRIQSCVPKRTSRTSRTHKCPVKKLTIVFNILSYNILEGIFIVGGFEIRY